MSSSFITLGIEHQVKHIALWDTVFSCSKLLPHILVNCTSKSAQALHAVLAPSISFPVKMNWECTPHKTGFILSHVHSVIGIDWLSGVVKYSWINDMCTMR